jgi:hypothetical protein
MMPKTQEHARATQQESGWDRAYQEVETARSQNTEPNVSEFTDLTKSAGGE